MERVSSQIARARSSDGYRSSTEYDVCAADHQRPDARDMNEPKVTAARALAKRAPLSARLRRSLSSRLLVLVAGFVLLAELVLLIPSVSQQRLTWLEARLEAAYLVGLALDSPGGEMIAPDTAEQLFSTANILGVTLERDDTRMPIMTSRLTEEQARVMRFVRLDGSSAAEHISDAWTTLLSTGDHSIRVIGKPKYAGGGMVDMFVSQAALRRDLVTYARNVLLLSMIISTLTAGLLFWFLDELIVAPVKRLTRNMEAFEADPDNESLVLRPSAREDEIGHAERSLENMERRLMALLRERQRLAALGAGISKISHDLRNILASAQLMSDRLASSEDPRVRKLTPRLISSLDRAIALSRDTLSYARMEPAALKKDRVVLRPLIDDIFDDAASMRVSLVNEVGDEVAISADPTQLYRALFNLVRNAVDAQSRDDADETAAPTGEVRISTRADQSPETGATRVAIIIADKGPGLPQKAIDHLFEPFKGSFKPGGSGLGAAIAYEIARAHGGDLKLARNSADGAVFELILPA
jgi:signal transduction histidine kinase